MPKQKAKPNLRNRFLKATALGTGFLATLYVTNPAVTEATYSKNVVASRTMALETPLTKKHYPEDRALMKRLGVEMPVNPPTIFPENRFPSFDYKGIKFVLGKDITPKAKENLKQAVDLIDATTMPGGRSYLDLVKATITQLDVDKTVGLSIGQAQFVQGFRSGIVLSTRANAAQLQLIRDYPLADIIHESDAKGNTIFRVSPVPTFNELLEKLMRQLGPTKFVEYHPDNSRGVVALHPKTLEEDPPYFVAQGLIHEVTHVNVAQHLAGLGYGNPSEYTAYTADTKFLRDAARQGNIDKPALTLAKDYIRKARILAYVRLNQYEKFKKEPKK